MKNSITKQDSPMHVRYHKFNPKEILRIRASTHKDAAFILGQQIRKSIHTIIKKYDAPWIHKGSAIVTARQLLKRLDSLSNMHIGTVGGVNYIIRYKDIFDAYVRGACISRSVKYPFL